MKIIKQMKTSCFFTIFCGFLMCLIACNGGQTSSSNISSSLSSENVSSSSSSEVIIDEQIDFTKLLTASGNFISESNSLVAMADKTIAYSTSYALEEGTISVEMKNADIPNDNGIVFNLSNSSKSFWENNASYYFYFISKNNTSYLGKVYQNKWTCLSDIPLSTSQIGLDYRLKVVKYHCDGYDLIECYVDDVLMNKCRDYSPLSGKGLGVRAGGTGTEYKNMFINSETGPKEKGMKNYYLSNGEFVLEDNRYVSKLNNSIIVHKSKTLEYGSISSSLKIKESGDNGIIFALQDNGNKAFWEDGVSYYFFFISSSGTAYLGKVTNNSWKELGVVSIPQYDMEQEYCLKVSRNDISILCYINDQLMLNCVDSSPLTGNKVGIRAGSKDSSFTDLDVQPSGSYDYKDPEGFDITSGKMVQFQNIIQSVEEDSLIVSQNGQKEGTIKVKMCPGSLTNNGIVFNLTAPSGSKQYYEREEGLSYYFFHISTNSSARLLRFEGETVQIVSEFGLSAGWSGSKESLLTVIVNGNNIKCYVDDACFVNYTDSNFLPGSLYGLRAAAKGALFSQFEVSENKDANRADVVLFGHSHCQFYETIHKDLASLGTIANMGVGGSIIANWEKRINQIASYNAKYIFVWLGSNDLGTGMTASDVSKKLIALVDALHDAAPSSQIVVFTEFYQPEAYRATEEYHAHIRNLNDSIMNRFPEFTVGLDLFDIPLKDGVLDLNMFRDVYHLKPEAYRGVTERILNLIHSLEN